MSNRIFYGLIAIVLIAAFVLAMPKSKHDKPTTRLGTAQAEEKNASNHIMDSQQVSYSQPIPTSGPHGQEAPWGYSPTQLPNQAIIHNMEHGGVVVSYRPDLDEATVNRLKALFTKPWSGDSHFTPSKAIVMPRQGQKDAIVLASWNRLLKLSAYNKQVLENYYYTNEGKSPEPNGV